MYNHYIGQAMVLAENEEIKMNAITLYNDFHNTSVTLRMKGTYPTESQVRRAKKTLCGISGCTCSGVMGMRGTQEIKIIGQEYLNGELVPGFAQ